MTMTKWPLTSICTSICAAVLATAAMPLAAQDAAEDTSEEASEDTRGSGQARDPIVVTGEIENDSGESTRERVLRIGRQINLPARSGLPAARFRAPLCIMVSGLPDDLAPLVKERIEENARQLRGVRIADDSCKANAFLGFLNNVNDAVETLEKEQKWLFEGLKTYQRDRIYRGSDAVRSWHAFSTLNEDGTEAVVEGSGDRQRGLGSLVNRTERASRIQRQQSTMVGAVVLIETAALREKTLRQIADYASVRLLASVSDDVTSDTNTPPTILTLFNEEFAPASITDFDMAYLTSLYELPSTSRDAQIIATAVDRYMDILKEQEANQAGG